MDIRGRAQSARGEAMDIRGRGQDDRAKTNVEQTVRSAVWRTRTMWVAAVAGAVAIVALTIAVIILAGQVHRVNVRADQTHASLLKTNAAVDQTLAIAHTFLCQQTPTPKGCPPQPPNGSGAAIQQAVDQIISRIEAIYPPPNGLP